jgi:dTDP-L-rhamnose 4-epimerase
MRVLLTGSAGFIGGAVARNLAADGVDVVGADALLPSAHPSGAATEDGTLRLDLRDPAGWQEALDGIDVVCHQAALVGTGVHVDDLPDYAAHNDLGTATLLAAMHRAGVHRLVLASSMVVYGEGRYACREHGPAPAPARRVDDLDAGVFDHRCPVCGDLLDWSLVEEDAVLDPRSSYAASKVAQEHYARAWARQAGGSVVALRYHNVYGPGMPRDTPYSGVAAMFRSAVERGEPPRVFEDGRQMRDFVHVDDVARANALAIGAVDDAEPGAVSVYNVCSGRPVSIGAVAGLLAGASGPAPVVTAEYRLGDVRHVVASPRRAATELGFTAAIGPESGLPAFATAPLR